MVFVRALGSIVLEQEVQYHVLHEGVILVKNFATEGKVEYMELGGVLPFHWVVVVEEVVEGPTSHEQCM